MKILLATLAILVMATTVHAAPFLVSDPSTDNATSCLFESFQLPCTLDASKVIKVDLASLPVGVYKIRAQFCRDVWCSDWSSFFDFSRPTLGKPGNIRLMK
jgi:hypothetical protein